jgi:hypothetical protein
MKKPSLLLLALVCAFAFALPSFGADNPQKPGRWEITTDIDMPGMPMKIPPTTRTVCVTKEDIEKNPERTIPKPQKRGGGEREDCKISDYKVDKNTVSWTVKCEGEHPLTGNGKMTYEAESFNGVTEMKMGDREMKVVMKGKFLGGECSKDEKK